MLQAVSKDGVRILILKPKSCFLDCKATAELRVGSRSLCRVSGLASGTLQLLVEDSDGQLLEGPGACMYEKLVAGNRSLTSPYACLWLQNYEWKQVH